MKAPSRARTAQRIAFTLATIQTTKWTTKIAIAMEGGLPRSSLTQTKLSLTTSSPTQETTSRTFTMTQAGPMEPARTTPFRISSSSLVRVPTQTSNQAIHQSPLLIPTTITTTLSLPLRTTTVMCSRTFPSTTLLWKRTKLCPRSRNAASRSANCPSICSRLTQLLRAIRVSWIRTW